jgi:penicillin-binding protein 1A
VGSFFVSFGVGFAYAAWAMACLGGRCPSVDVLDQYQPRQTSKVYAADGRFVAELGLERRTLIKVSDIPPMVRAAFIATEDKRFYKHAGIDWYRVPGAMLHNIRHGNFEEGFSTITMQLARNIFPERISREKSPVRKLKEVKVARAIEAKYSKDRILELYLNQIYLGNGAYGLETAAQRYFGKSTRDLNVAEAATLAGLPKGPERYNPRRFPDRAVQRRNTVIALMRAANVINDADARLARAYPLRLARKAESGEAAPYYVEWVRQLLDEKFGKQLYEQGLKVYTTLDLDLQSAAERALERQMRAIELGRFGPYKHISFERYIARETNNDENGASANSPYLQGAFIAMDPRNGAIRALVGGRDFDDSKFNRAVQSLRQPGSTFKPIVYADAVQNGRPMSYILDDSPLAVRMDNNTTWTPQNYDGAYAGKVTMRKALYQSRNVPTIRLGMELGEQSVIDMARKFGLTTPIPAYPSIFIGAADVVPLELVAAYSAFATLGTRATPQGIVRVEDNSGQVLWEPEPTRVPVMSPEESWLMVSAMKDVVQRGTAAGSVGGVFRYPAAGKTGTTNDGTDVWFVGYTADLVAGVWMGFDKPQKIKSNAQGGQLAAPAWTAFMTEAYRRRGAPPDWPTPPGIVARQVDFSTSLLATAYCPRDLVGVEYYIPGTEPMRQCDVHTGYLLPDTSGTGGYVPGSPPTYTPGAPPRIDTSASGRVSRADSIGRRLLDSLRRVDSLRRLDSLRRRPDSIPRRPPDTTRIIPIRPGSPLPRLDP